MGLIREPRGVDFIVNSRPLTKKEQEALSKFISEDKEKRLKKSLPKKTMARTLKKITRKKKKTT